MGKAGRIKEERNKKISWGGNCTKNEVPEISLKCLTIARKTKWEKSIERAEEGNWVLYSDGSKNEEGRVGSGWALHGGKIQGEVELGKLATGWD